MVKMKNIQEVKEYLESEIRMLTRLLETSDRKYLGMFKTDIKGDIEKYQQLYIFIFGKKYNPKR